MTTCLISMPLNPPFDSYYKVVARAVTQLGLQVVVTEDFDRPQAMREQIAGAMAAADVCVMDLSTRNFTTLYALGMAHGMNKPVVYLVQNDTDLPFDLRFVRRINYRPNTARWEDMLSLQLQTALRDCFESSA